MINEIQRFIKRVSEGKHLSMADAGRAFQIVMAGGATPAQMAALLVALRMKGESVGELTGAAKAMRAKMDTLPPQPGLMDVCGTGGDGSGMLNVSTAVAIVTAGAGVKIVKHGNRSVSSRSGSADVLSNLGVNIHAGKETAAKALTQCNICFLFAPIYHKAMRHVAPVRQELAQRTIFNLLGPLVNPAQPDFQLMGVYDRTLLLPMAQVLQALGSKRAWIVHGSDGADELTLTGPSHIAELNNNMITHFTVTPEDAGLTPCVAADLEGGSPKYNAKELSLLLSGKKSAYRDIVLLNTAAALVVAGRAASLPEAVALAVQSIDEGHAKATLAQLITITNSETKQELHE